MGICSSKSIVTDDTERAEISRTTPNVALSGVENTNGEIEALHTKRQDVCQFKKEVQH